jgi:hypothetical protein
MSFIITIFWFLFFVSSLYKTFIFIKQEYKAFLLISQVQGKCLKKAESPSLLARAAVPVRVSLAKAKAKVEKGKTT